MITDYHAAYYAWELTRRHSSVELKPLFTVRWSVK